MAIKDKRKRYKKGERVDMRGGGRVRLQRGTGRPKRGDEWPVPTEEN